MGQSREQRKANREARRQRRKTRRAKFRKVLDEARRLPDFSDAGFEGDFREKFNTIWPAVRAALDFIAILRFIPQPVERMLDRVLIIGDRMETGVARAEEEDEFVEQLTEVWSTARTVLGLATIVTGSRVDDAVEKIISIGDWITDLNEEEGA